MSRNFVCNIVFASLSIVFLMSVLVLNVKAEVIIDKSFGKEQVINVDNNKTYNIDAEYGYQEGPNLFHSFKSFNIDKGMTATFTGPPTIQRIISRVTGGEMSEIYGTIKSTIQDADLFLLNPNGIIFAETARLDIDGSFYVSTADYLQMTESEKFMTGSTETSGLVTSAPRSFGFIDADIASITFKGSEPIIQKDYDEISTSYKDINTKFPMDNGLTVKGNNDFCIIGGQITIEQGISIGLKDSTNNADMQKGTIQLISIDSQADVNLNNMLDYSQNTKFDNITIKGSILNASGQTVGGINIVGNNINVENSIIYMDNFGKQDAQPIKLIGNNISLLLRSKIISNTFAQGDAAPIYLKASADILLKEKYSSIYSFSDQDINIDGEKYGSTSNMSFIANNFYLKDGSRILSRTHKKGNCSDISIQVDNKIGLSSKNSLYDECSIFFETYGPGNAGTIDLKANIVEFSDGSKLSVSTNSTGQGGNIRINAEEVLLNGTRHDPSKPDMGSRIFLRSYGREINAGDSGNLYIHATNIIMDDGAEIRAQTYGFGKGGDITLIAKENILLGGIDGRNKPAMINASCDQYRLNSGEKQSGYITISAKNIELKDGAWISTQTEGNGNAGTIQITAVQRLKLSGEGNTVKNIDKDKLSSCIISSARSKSKGNGGKIIINANEVLLADGAYIETGTESSGDAGEINIHTQTLTLMQTNSDNQSSMIESNTHAKQLNRDTHITGTGGEVTINARNINLFDGAQISTSSIADIESSGIAGTIHINTGGTLRISGQNSDTLDVANKSSGIYARSKQNIDAHAGDAGNIDIVANNLIMDNNGLISTGSNGQSDAGDINIQTRQSILLTHSRIASESTMPVSGNQNGGAAGSIRIISGGDVQLFQSAHITTNAASSGGGKIDINNQNALTLINSNITTNVSDGEGNGGDINIHTDLTVMNHSIISANAKAGNGGAIYIYTRNLLQSTDSRIEATSEFGNDGSVEIETPDVDEIPNLLNLSDNFLNAINIVNTLCGQTNNADTIQFVVHSPFIPDLSATWYQFSTNISPRLLSSRITDQFDNFSSDFSDEALYQDAE